MALTYFANTNQPETSLITNVEALVVTKITTKTTTVTCEGGLLSPLYRLLFGSTVVTETEIVNESPLLQFTQEAEFANELEDWLLLEELNEIIGEKSVEV
jgi:hypothetical protein